MPLRLYDNDADWNAAYPPTEALIPGSPYFPAWEDKLDPNWEWAQAPLNSPSLTWGPYATRYISPGGTDWRRAVRIVFSEEPKEWQRNISWEGNDLADPYDPAAIPELFIGRRNRLINAFGGFSPGDSVLVLGAGTNGLAAAFAEAGYNAWGVEDGLWLYNHPNSEGVFWNQARLCNVDWTANNAPNQIRSISGVDGFDHVIDEHLFVGYTDAELVAERSIQGTTYRLIDEPERFLATGVDPSRVLHFVSAGDANAPIDPSVVNKHEKAWWEALVPTHSVFNVFDE